MRGVFQVRSHYGYDIVVDGVSQGLDVHWAEAARIGNEIAATRPPGDGRGFARCRHKRQAQRDACFKAERCLLLDRFRLVESL